MTTTADHVAFAPGDRVRARVIDPDHHIRLPRYVRGQEGEVIAARGWWPLADDVARQHAEPRVEPLYTVRFAAADLWGPPATHLVTVDLWEPYLEAPNGQRQGVRP